MNTTINISLPTSMYAEAKKTLRKRGYASISELIRDALRDWLYPTRITKNGFTPKFEAQVLRSAANPKEKDKIWASEKDIDHYFDELGRKIRKQKR